MHWEIFDAGRLLRNQVKASTSQDLTLAEPGMTDRLRIDARRKYNLLNLMYSLIYSGS